MNEELFDVHRLTGMPMIVARSIVCEKALKAGSPYVFFLETADDPLEVFAFIRKGNSDEDFKQIPDSKEFPN